MAASANSAGNQEGNHDSSSFNAGNPSNGNSGPAVENSGPRRALKHWPDGEAKWTAEEQSMLDERLTKYASDSVLMRCSKIAMDMPGKSIRDIAFRCKWMTKKEIGKRRKEDHNLPRKTKDKKEKVSDPSAKSSSHLAVRPNVPAYTLPVIPMDNEDGISYKAIGGTTGQLLEQNSQAFKQISANLAACQIQENINLFCQTRDNILAILNNLHDMPESMRQMPPLPVKVNEELANSILP